MPVYYFIYLFFILGVLFLVVRHLFLKRTSVLEQMLMEGIRAENSGLYAEAAARYENALTEMKNKRFHRKLEIEIREKLKVLRTVTTYERDQEFVRENNSYIS